MSWAEHFDGLPADAADEVVMQLVHVAVLVVAVPVVDVVVLIPFRLQWWRRR